MSDDSQPNEILAAAAAAKAHEVAAADRAEKKARDRRWEIGKIGLGVGIGSAAVAAAVLFASRDKK